MRRAAALLLVLLTGCSTAPLADIWDFFAPGRMTKGDTTPYGGVCIPQGGPVVQAPLVPAPVMPSPFAPAPLLPTPAVPAPIPVLPTPSPNATNPPLGQLQSWGTEPPSPGGKLKVANPPAAPRGDYFNPPLPATTPSTLPGQPN